VINAQTIRKLFASDSMAAGLLRHCAQEMIHLLWFLPALYQEIGRASRGLTRRPCGRPWRAAS
jgi:hypothetical protein